MGADFSLAAGVGTVTLYIFTARLDANGAPVETQPVAFGQSVSIAVTSGNTGVGTITTSPVTIANGDGYVATQFQPASVGTTTLTAAAPGYGTASVHASVTLPNVIVAGGITIGQYLQDVGQLILPVAAPTGGLQVTITSNSSLLKLAANATGAGASTITLNMKAGDTTATYYMQSLGTSGTVTYTATASGYGAGTGTIYLAPSGIVILGPSNVTLSGGPQNITMYTAQLSTDGTNTPVNPQALAGPSSLTVTLNDTNRGVGTVPASVVISPGANSSVFQFTPVAAGSTSISVVQPNGWTTPNTYTQVGIFVQ
jgi:hypothetical protein